MPRQKDTITEPTALVKPRGARAERDGGLEQAHAHHREFLALASAGLLARGSEAMVTPVGAVYR